MSFEGWYFEGRGMRVRLKFGCKAFENASNKGIRGTTSVTKTGPSLLKREGRKRSG